MSEFKRVIALLAVVVALQLQKGASFGIDQVKERIKEAIAAHAGS